MNFKNCWLLMFQINPAATLCKTRKENATSDDKQDIVPQQGAKGYSLLVQKKLQLTVTSSADDDQPQARLLWQRCAMTLPPFLFHGVLYCSMFVFVAIADHHSQGGRCSSLDS
jgi:hypothetical protein